MYEYKTERPALFTEQGQRDVICVRDLAFKLIAASGVVRMDKLMIISGSSWYGLAIVDRLVELGDLREVLPSSERAAQYRLFERARGG